MRLHNHNIETVLSSIFALLLVAQGVLAQTGGGYDLTWSTVDSGGLQFSTGGSYTLGGATGQPDAGPVSGPLTGGSYSLVGGYWPAAQCICVSDLNYDKKRDGKDVQGFIACFLGFGTNCACADMNHDGVLDMTDLNLFVGGLLSTTSCP